MSRDPGLALPKLESVVVEQDEHGVVITYELVVALEHIVFDTMMVGVAVIAPDRALAKHFAVKFFASAEPAVFVFDFASATQANYRAEQLETAGRTLVVRYPDSSLGVHRNGELYGFTTLNGEDIITRKAVTLFV